MIQWKWTDKIGGTSIFPDGKTTITMMSSCVPYPYAQLILTERAITPGIYDLILRYKGPGVSASHSIDYVTTTRLGKNYNDFVIKAPNLEAAKKKAPALLKKAIKKIIATHQKTYNGLLNKLF